MPPATPPTRPTTYLPTRPNPLTYQHIRVCPECAGPVAHNSGCITCRACGWGKCG